MGAAEMRYNGAFSLLSWWSEITYVSVGPTDKHRVTNDNRQGKTEALMQISVPVPLCPLQFPHGKPWHRHKTRRSEVEKQPRVLGWLMQAAAHRFSSYILCALSERHG